MRIAFLNTYGNGSTGKIVDSLKNQCVNNGIVAESFFSREYCATPDSSHRCFNKVGFYNDALMTRIFDNHGLNSSHNTKQIISKLKEFNPDIIHIHNLHGYWINYKLLFDYIIQNNKKAVLTMHDCWTITGHCTHFDYIGCNKWETGCHNCPQKGVYPKSSLCDRSKRNYQSKKEAFTSLPSNSFKIVTPSDWLRDIAKSSYLSKYEIITIHNGVDLEVFRPRVSDLRKRYGINNSKFVLGVANYWTETKGLKYLIRLAQEKKEWKFVVIGRIPEKDISLENNIVCIDRTENQIELAEWYSTADVYFNPTLEDNYPTTNLEAIACNTPVATFLTGGSPEIVNDTGYGKVINDKDMDDIISTIEECMELKGKIGVDTSLLCDDVLFSAYVKLYKELSTL